MASASSSSADSARPAIRPTSPAHHAAGHEGAAPSAPSPRVGPGLAAPDAPHAADAAANASANDFARLVNNRHSCRAFLPEPPPAGTIERLVTLARAAPSGANLQPGEFILVAEAARERLCTALVDAWRSGAREAEDYTYFPEPMPLALRKRQVAAARALYDALGVARDDRKGRDAQFERNFRFFDAPLALLVTIDAKLGAGAYMDLGMTLHGLLLAAAAEGLGACAIGALALYPRLIRQTLGLDPARNIVCGVALGYADERAPVNRTRTARSTLDDFFTVLR